MISRNGTRISGASSGVTKILRDDGNGPVVTAGSVVSGLERMFMAYPPVNFVQASCIESSLRGALATKQSSSLQQSGLLRFARNDGCETVLHYAVSAFWRSQSRTRASGSAACVTSLTTAMESAPA